MFNFWAIVDDYTGTIEEVFEGTWEEVRSYVRIAFGPDYHIVTY